METRAPHGAVPFAAIDPPKAKRSSAVTDLPKSKTVEPVSKPSKAGSAVLAEEEARREQAKARNEALRAQSQTDVMTHQATGSLVVQTRDSTSGEVLHQFPNNPTLKQRAMARYEAIQGAPTIRRLV